VIPLDDGVIIDLLFKRCETAIEETRRKYGQRLIRTANNILNNIEDAEECVSDALMKAWASIPPNRPEMLGAYLMKIVRNLSINRLESRNASKRGGGETDLLLSELEECLPSPTGTEDEYESLVVTNAIGAFLNKQDKTARVAFILRYFHGDSINEITQRFKMNESKVKSILFRMRKKLRKHLEKEGIII
jgi:RNA polymerase sigma-70 factor (ECF subfamily)